MSKERKDQTCQDSVKTELGKKLKHIRDKAIAGGLKLLSEKEIIDEHWAVKAVGDDRLVRAWRTIAGHDADGDAVWSAAMAYEIAAIEGLDAMARSADTDEQHAQLRSQVQHGASRAYVFRRMLPIPEKPEDRVLHVLHLAALACCGDRLDDLQCWFNEHAQEILLLLDGERDLGLRLLYHSYCRWVDILFNRRPSKARNIIDDPSNDLAQIESIVAQELGDNGIDAVAARRIALCHLFKATDLLAMLLADGGPERLVAEVDEHFEHSCRAASMARAAVLDGVVRWLRAASKRLIELRSTKNDDRTI